MAKKKRTRKSTTESRFPRMKFEGAGKPLTGSTVSFFAQQLDLTDDHQKLLRKSNGGTPDRAHFTWEMPNTEPHESLIDDFLGINERPFGPDRRSDIISVILAYRDDLPAAALPIARVDRDDLLLTFTSGKRLGQIWIMVGFSVFTDELFNGDDHVYFVADSLSDFLNSLSRDRSPE